MSSRRGQFTPRLRRKRSRIGSIPPVIIFTKTRRSDSGEATGSTPPDRRLGNDNLVTSSIFIYQIGGGKGSKAAAIHHVGETQ